MKSSPAPAAPDPKATAAAQTATNISTAQANAILGNVNQVTPDGTLTYTQSGSQFVSDPTAGQTYWRGPNGEIQSSAPTTTTGGGRRWVSTSNEYSGRGNDYLNVNVQGGAGQGQGYWVDEPGTQTPASGWTQVQGYYIPQYTATQKLSPQQQAIKDQTDAAELNLGTIANQQSRFLIDYLSKPVKLDNEATEARLFDLGRKRLDPALAERTAGLQSQLASQGIKLGSAAYDRAMRSDTEGRNDAYNSLLLSGRSQAVQELLTERNQPLNEIAALLSGSQVSQPQWAQTNMPTIPTTDYAGLVSQKYQADMAAWQQKQQSKGAMLGGLFSLGASALGNPAFKFFGK